VRGFLIFLWVGFLASLALLVFLFYGIASGWFGAMPSFKDLENPETNLASQIYSSDGIVLGAFYVENRSNIHFRDLPDHLVNAFLAIEDIRFTEHSGIDERALVRVAWGLL
ncbi:transglycosylase domain-containing protein, partial [Arthrospira platensis SPKY1]|nr:transglycosylase domain-containing protein [Arthrospira platensis SPKY1]